MSSALEQWHQENTNLRRNLWLAVKSAGGRVTISRQELERFNPERSKLITTPSNVDGSLTIEAKEET